MRSKTFSNGRTYYYLVRGERVNGKVRQKVIKYLGKAIPAEYQKGSK